MGEVQVPCRMLNGAFQIVPDSGERYVSTPFFAPEPERAGAA